MGFEEVVPPVPTREQEREFIERLEKNFLGQPEYKYYMNEALRTRKIHDSYNMNDVRRHFYLHLGIGLLVSAPFVLVLGRLYRRWGSGVPLYFRPKNYYSAASMEYKFQYRNMKQLLIQLPLWAFLSVGYAVRFTDYSKLDDEYLENLKPFRQL